VRHVDVRVAQAGVGVPDQDLTVLRSLEVEFLDLDRFARLIYDGGSGLHVRFPLEVVLRWSLDGPLLDLLHDRGVAAEVWTGAIE